MQNLPNGLTPRMLDGWVKDNPGSTAEDGVREYILHTSRKSGRSVGETLRDAYTSVVDPIASTLAGGIDTAVGSLAPGGGEGPGTEGSRGMAADLIAKTVVPQTPEAAALMVAAGPIARIGAPGRMLAGRPMTASATRVGASTGLGAGVAGATGGDPATGAMEGFLGQSFGELARAGMGTFELAKNVVTRRKQLKMSQNDAESILMGLLNDVPAFTHPASGIPMTGIKGGDAEWVLSELLLPQRGSRRLRGEAALSAHYQAMDDQILKLFGKDEIASNAIAQRHGLPPAQLAPTFKVKEALEELKIATSDAMRAPSGAEGHAVRTNARKIREEILAAITAKDPALAQMYEREFQGYSKGLIAIRALQDSGAFAGSVRKGTGPTVDGEKFLEYLNVNRDLVGALPNTVEALLRGAKFGGKTVTRDIGGERLYAGHGVSGRVPKVSIEIEPRSGQVRTPTLGLKENRNLLIPSIATMVGANTTAGYTVE